MISHKHKCIFIHIPRTAGTSIEKWIQGLDQWAIQPNEKHLTSSQAKQKYSEYWHEYFKFAFVRDPLERMISCLTYPEHFGLNLSNKGDILTTAYKIKFGRPLTIEHDHRFSNRDEILALSNQDSYGHLVSNCVYKNILSENLDKIYKYEELNESITDLAKSLKLDLNTFPKKEHLKKRLSAREVSKRTLVDIQEIYSEDFKTFNYTPYTT